MYQYNCIIERVVDGDTIRASIDLGFQTWLRDVSIRVLNINAPETRTKDLIEKAAGLKTKARVEELLPVGSKAVVNTVIDKEKFGRILGDFLIDRGSIGDSGPYLESLGSILVAEGLAKPYFL